MKELLARFVYWLVGHVLWRIRTHEGVEWIVDNGNEWEVKWWIFHEEGGTEHEACTRRMGNIGVWSWGDELRITRWTGRRLHFAYRHSFRSGKGMVSFFKMLGVAYRLGL